MARDISNLAVAVVQSNREGWKAVNRGEGSVRPSGHI